ncbi:hypothetical protein pphageT12_37 [Pseudomonas phage pphageT12]|uniref:Uncharacterized protein n=1 Tax=Pseudomonas phage phiB1_1 TaxID=2755402 RepID=A0A7D7FAK5_9CAUD|nr:hypothetical protein phiB1_1_28 [Pseudomonas phage phiB1_1]UAW53669.1 hypothetical protein pphageB21_36 [Pseudomonas phage pphageB21]UAW53728.1 hypothetical protein pphageT21_36 [Pseudomonas phage pphageT21]UAW53788.1 hypothetical protein pphageT12_37 [Pseudomonas phage pphageT12]UAW53847.1 hypothetical protein pphageBV72_35 [Pseudomonas phage pphageBV72]
MNDVRKVFRSTFNRLSNDMTACVDTGNHGEAKLVLKQAQEALDNGSISLQQMGDIQSDFNTL